MDLAIIDDPSHAFAAAETIANTTRPRDTAAPDDLLTTAERLLRRGDIGAAITCAEQAIVDAAFEDRPDDGRVPHVTLAAALDLAGRGRDATRILAEGRLRFDRPHDGSGGVQRAWRAATISDAAVTSNVLAGRWGDALAETGPGGLAGADRAWLSVRSLSHLGVMALHRGDLACASVASKAAWRRHASGLDPVDGMYAAWLDSMLADAQAPPEASVAGNSLADALPWFTAVLEGLVDADLAGPALTVVPDHATLAHRIGDAGPALALLDRLAPVVERADGPMARSAELHARAVLLRSLDDAVRAVELARGTDRPLHIAASCELAGTLALDEGDVVTARLFLEQALAIVDALGAVVPLRRVRAALRRAGVHCGARGARTRPAQGWGALTPSERQVADLALTGMANAEIAERLYISRRTVESHMSSVLRKMGVTNRAALMACPGRP